MQKEAEEKYTEAELKNRHKIRLEYWERALESIQKKQIRIVFKYQPLKRPLDQCRIRGALLSIFVNLWRKSDSR